VPTSQWFPPRGRVTTGSKQSEIFGNGTRCERGHGRIIARKGAGCDDAIDGNGGPRGTGARYAASRGGTLLGHVRIVTAATRRVSDTDISSRYEDDQRLGLAICDSSTGKGQSHGTECEDPAISTATGFAYDMQKDAGQSAGQNVAQGDGRGRVRSCTRQGAAYARQCSPDALLARYGSVVCRPGDGRGAADLENRRMGKANQGRNELCRRPEQRTRIISHQRSDFRQQEQDS
jgi:hypothetical protein